jgi:hypothetical protein
MDESKAITATSGRDEWRLRVLAVPSPTFPRFLLLLLALLTAGVAVGMDLFILTGGGREYVAQTQRCGDVATTGLEPWYSCMEAVQRRLAWFELGGLALAAFLGLTVLAAAPAVVRQRRRLLPLDDRLAAASERVQQLALEGRVRRSPQVMTGPSTVREAFSYGLPGRYRLVLPPALAVRSRTSTFDTVVRHEVAHLNRHDVLIAWSARGLWIALLPLLAVPSVWSLATGDTSRIGYDLPRAALLLLAGGVAAAGVLRAREFDADLTSATSPAQQAALVEILNGVTVSPQRGWRRFISLHPDARTRAATVEHPGLLAQAPVLDAALAGFFAAVAIPLLDYLISHLGHTRVPNVPALIIGAVMGATVGLSLARLALVERAAGGSTTLHKATSRTALAVLTGYLIGGATSLANVGVAPYPLTFAPWAAAAMAGATFVTGGVGILLADVAPRLTPRIYAFAAIGISAVVFAIALWGVDSIVNDVSLGGWGDQAQIAINVLLDYGVHGWVTIVALSVLVLLRLRRGSARAPSWLIQGDGAAPVWEKSPSAPGLRQTLILGACAGLAADVAILAFRLTEGPSASPAEDLQRLVSYAWAWGAAGALTAVALLIVYGLQGLAAALLASPIAAALAATVFVVGNNFTGGHLSLALALNLVWAGITLGVLLLIPLSTLAFIPPAHRATGRRALVAALVAAALGGAVSSSLLVLDDTLSPIAPDGISKEEYLGDYTPWINSEFHRIGQAVQQIGSDQPAPAETARRIRAEVVVPFRYMRDSAASLAVADEGLREVHLELVAGLQLNVAAYEDIAQAYESRDQTLLAAGEEELDRAGQRIVAWSQGLQAMAR